MSGVGRKYDYAFQKNDRLNSDREYEFTQKPSPMGARLEGIPQMGILPLLRERRRLILRRFRSPLISPKGLVVGYD